MMAKPRWFDYIVWDYSDPSFPMAVGFKKGTPQDIIDEYNRDQNELEEEGDGTDAFIWRYARYWQR